MIPAFGWQSVFIFGGAIPLVIALAMIWGLPESLQFLAVSGRGRATLARWLRQLDPTIRVDAATRVCRQRGGSHGRTGRTPVPRRARHRHAS